MTTPTATTKPTPKRTMSKARLYKEVEKQAKAYDMETIGATLGEFLERLGNDVITEATK
jgi:hypothetical protein